MWLTYPPRYHDRTYYPTPAQWCAAWEVPVVDGVASLWIKTAGGFTVGYGPQAAGPGTGSNQMEFTSQELGAAAEGPLAHLGVEPSRVVGIAYLSLLGGSTPSVVLSRKMAKDANRWSVLGLVGKSLFELEVEPSPGGNFTASETEIITASIHRLTDARSLSMVSFGGDGWGQTFRPVPTWRIGWGGDDYSTIRPYEHARTEEIEKLDHIVGAVRAALVG